MFSNLLVFSQPLSTEQVRWSYCHTIIKISVQDPKYSLNFYGTAPAAALCSITLLLVVYKHEPSLGSNYEYYKVHLYLGTSLVRKYIVFWTKSSSSTGSQWHIKKYLIFITKFIVSWWDIAWKTLACLLFTDRIKIQ